MLINGKRALAYITTVDEVKPIPNYDRVEYARTAGWWCIVSKEDCFKVGDKCVYFEIDSLVPSTDERFDFLEKRNYKVRTLRMCKVISQGLIMPLSKFPELKALEINTDVTKTLGIIYADAEDNVRKSAPDPNAKYKSMTARHEKIFKTWWARRLMKYSWGRKLLFFFFGKKKDKPLGFPTKFPFVHKSDESRIENLPQLFGNTNSWTVTEKLDGTSSTYILERKPFGKFEFYVLSRNVRQMRADQKCYHESNIYWENAIKYNIEQRLKDYLLAHPDMTYVCIQGESVGNIQGNPLKLKEDDLYLFNFINSKYGRAGSLEGKDWAEGNGMKWVPILGIVHGIPDTIEEIKKLATGNSAVNPAVLREGLVYRSLDGKTSFKNVSNEFLLNKK